ncbi:helix-turn-helix domain-containing protein [Aminobacter aganoensis]|uniref:Transcriptional regulator with XRE-family HTH domain n=1 Tax=Aminobacter aganoensis TaxID=83264 RepID=A0A7X0KJX6_9HYPH|nr:helix-turn-helix domain-containing protein [Aminobacter aganoensis]MBB6353518.1 transcriptional regulator with XRE-family HTH domain [Aminobacter aganoensis]
MSVIRHIRKTVFRLSQAEFAAIAGVTQATVSRWEKGGSPTLEEMQRIRDAAAERRIKWSDKLFFEPAPSTKPERAA